jgi:hypothetical protein
MAAIASLEEGKKPVVYFTQGNGELDVFGSVQGLPPERRGQALADGLAKRDNYEVKGLILAAEGPPGLNPRIVVSKTVPDDAAVVIIAGPIRPLSDDAIDALKKYMREPHKEKDPVTDKERTRKGKLMVLANVVASGDRMASLNLDKLLQEYGVDVTGERVLRFVPGARHPENDILITPNPDMTGKNPLATLFEGFAVRMNNVRVIRPVSPDRAPGSPYQASELLISVPAVAVGYPVIGETDMRPPAQLIEDYAKERKQELRAKARSSLPVAVAVSEQGAPDPNDPHAFMGGARSEGPPRVEVFGDATFVSNQSLGGQAGDEQVGQVNYDLFASALAWLREKPSSMGIEPKDRGTYTMQQNTNFTAMMLFPFGLMSLTIMGLGLGVWVARRR